MLRLPPTLANPASIRRPGFNPSHPAAKAPLISMMPSGGGIYDLVSGLPATLVGTGGAKTFFGQLGQCTAYLTSGNYNSCPSTTFTYPGLTVAAIFSVDGFVNTFNYVLNTDGAGLTGASIGTASAGNLVYSTTAGGANWPAPMGNTLVTNTPYFYAFSQNGAGNSGRGVLVRLDTGATLYQEITDFFGSDTTGTIFIGSRNSATRFADGKLARVMASGCFISKADMLAWAADPWGYWYRPALAVNDLSAVVVAAAATRRMALLGVGP